MELAQLEIFRAVAQHGSIAKAARALHRVPSNLTTRVRQLEAELGVALLIREKQRIRLSAAGTNFLDYASRILDLTDEARRCVTSDEPGGRFTVGAVESTAAFRLPEVMAAYHQRYPAVSLELFTGLSGPVIDEVVAGRYAAAFTDVISLHPALEGVPLYKENLVLIAARDQPAIRRPADIAGGAIFTFRQTCSYRRRFERWFEADGAMPARIVEIESYHSMLACVSAGAGVALLPERVLAGLQGGGRVSVHTLDAPHGTGETWLVWRKGTMTPNLRALLALSAPEALPVSTNATAHRRL
ncbi:LysR substrate-binding domain-containing protein [Robbsia sp. Bb-Pol-6]|uniref:LysR substrate-binding domain-containing protein n=1 Tax=Robbsia betulipollinis TaxID=2981849 RepID=A0ABT3ZJ54_9BURK|nr:LysR family transcriptional regulator [Robbsia betulipollinis]MCY0386536.1 LysR substrate-binding domain-containing protein [Robbsia betulipollinis]